MGKAAADNAYLLPRKTFGIPPATSRPLRVLRPARPALNLMGKARVLMAEMAGVA